MKEMTKQEKIFFNTMFLGASIIFTVIGYYGSVFCFVFGFLFLIPAALAIIIDDLLD